MNLVSCGSQTYSVFNYIFKRNLVNVFCYLAVLRGPNALAAPVLDIDSKGMG